MENSQEENMQETRAAKHSTNAGNKSRDMGMKQGVNADDLTRTMGKHRWGNQHR